MKTLTRLMVALFTLTLLGAPACKSAPTAEDETILGGDGTGGGPDDADEAILDDEPPSDLESEPSEDEDTDTAPDDEAILGGDGTSGGPDDADEAILNDEP